MMTHLQMRHFILRCKGLKVKVKEVDLYSAVIVVPHTQGAQVQITQCYGLLPANYTVPASTS